MKILFFSLFKLENSDCKDFQCPELQQLDCPADSHQQFRSIGSTPHALIDNATLNYSCCSHWECKCKTDYCNIPQCNNTMLIPIAINDKQLKQPGNCCLLYNCIKRDYCLSSITNKHYANAETWIEEDCTECQCFNGHTICHTSVCKSLTCFKTIQLQHKCCPVCDPNETLFCAGSEDCDIVCENGYHQHQLCHLCLCKSMLQKHILIYCLILLILLFIVVVLLGFLRLS